ncbi:MAG: sodium-translocating pyrophosphatase [Nitrososphaerales archaeon]
MVLETLIPIIASALALAYGALLIVWVLRQSPGNPNMLEISHAVKIGASAFLKRESLTITPIATLLTLIIAIAINWQTALGFLLGAILSGLTGYIGMAITVRSASRTVESAQKGLPQALVAALRGGAVMGMFITALALIGVTILYIIFQKPILIAGFGLGASLIALFLRVGGGIYTKAADLGADLVGKIEAGIPEDDPRNPAVIADNVGDNVGDCAGMGSDVFESYVVTMIATMIIGAIIAAKPHILIYPPLTVVDIAMVTYPLLIGAAGIIGSIAGTLIVRAGKFDDPMKPLNMAFTIAAITTMIMSFILTRMIFGDTPLAMSLFIATVLGAIIVVIIERVTDYYTNYKYKPVKETVEATKIGHSANILTGLAAGLKSTLPSAITIASAIIISYALTYSVTKESLVAIYATAITTTTMLSLSGIIMSIDSFGPITDNAGGIVEMTGLPDEVRNVTDRLDAVGNTTKATTKGFAIASAALAALTMIQAFQNEILRLTQESTSPFYERVFTYELSSVTVIIGLLIGGLLPFYFSSFLISAVGKTASSIVEEVRRQFREIPRILEGQSKPNYAKCIDIATKESIKNLILPGAIAIITPVVVGIILGPTAVAGLIIGAVISGVYLAYTMANSGAAWDNAKKYLEAIGRKKTPQYSIAVAGDLVGDPLKDTSGPSLNSLIKVLNTVAIVFIPILVGLIII